MVSNELIEKAREFHGHICPFLVLCLRVAEIALNKLGVKRAGVVLSCLKRVYAGHLADRDITELSSGEFQRALIARAMAAELEYSP